MMLGKPEDVEATPIAGRREFAHLGDDLAVAALPGQVVGNVKQAESHGPYPVVSTR